MRSRWVCAPPVSPSQANPNKEPGPGHEEPGPGHEEPGPVPVAPGHAVRVVFAAAKPSRLVPAAPVHGVAKHRVAAERAFVADRPSRQARVVPVVRVARAASEAVKHRVPAGLGFVVDKPLVVVLGLAAEPVRPASGAVRRNRLAPVAQVFAVDSKDSSLVVPVCVGLVCVV